MNQIKTKVYHSDINIRTAIRLNLYILVLLIERIQNTLYRSSCCVPGYTEGAI